MDATTWAYDEPTGLLTNKTDASGHSVIYDYYNNQMLKSCTWARGVSYTNLYNAVGDLTEVDYSDGTSNLIYGNYNREALPRLIVDSSGNRTLNYDVVNRTTAETWTNGIFNGITVSNHFDPVYGRDALKTIIPSSSTLETDYGYDTHGRMSSVSSGSDSANYGYLANSDLLATTTASHSSSTVLTTSKGWDYGFRLSGITNVVSGSTLTSHHYLYDNVNRRTQAILEDGSVWKYSYNDRNELTGAGRSWSDGSSVTGQQYGYGFDNIGNRTNALSGSSGNLRTTSYSANNLNEYSSITTPGYKDILGLALVTNGVTVNGETADRKGEYFHREIPIANISGPIWQEVTNTAGLATVTGGLVFPANSQSFTYDADGNLTYDGVWNYTWDAENRLISMTNVAGIAGIATSNQLRLDFSYDYTGRRTSKTVWTNSGVTFVPQFTNYFIYDDWNLIASFVPADAIQQTFVWGLDLSGGMSGAGGIGGLLAVSKAETNYFASYDGNGNIIGLISATDKSTSARYEYSPFGEVIRATGPLATSNPFRFSTKYSDQESGLGFYGHRYYSPFQGRWVNRDPIEEQGGNNLCAFVRNNSVEAMDPLGNSLIGTLLINTGEDADDVVEYKQGQSLVGMIRQVVTEGNNLQQFEAGIEEADGLDISSLMSSIQAAQGAIDQGLLGKKDSIKALKGLSDSHHVFPQAKSLASFFENNEINVDGVKASINSYMHRYGVHTPYIGGAYNQVWKDFAAGQEGESSNPYFVLGFGLGLFEKIAPDVLK